MVCGVRRVDTSQSGYRETLGKLTTQLVSGTLVHDGVAAASSQICRVAVRFVSFLGSVRLNGMILNQVSVCCGSVCPYRFCAAGCSVVHTPAGFRLMRWDAG